MTTDTTVNDISDIVRILREQPEWADALRGILLSEEILKLPEMVAELVESNKLIHERLDKLEGRMDGLEGRMDGLDGRMDRLEGEVSNLVGYNLEVMAHHNIASLVHEELDIVRIRVLKSRALPSYDILNNLIDGAEDAGRISVEQGFQIVQLDIILSAVFKEDRATRVGVAIEVSRVIDDSDIKRARERADILSAAVETPTIAAVLGGSIQPPQQRLAERLDVRTIINPEALLRRNTNHNR